MNRIQPDILADIDAISRIPAVSAILEVICRTTGMGFAAIARVTEDKWVCCAVRDEISFGLVPGGELTLETTICNEIRQNLQPVIIDQVDKDEVFRVHHTPAMYGFQSYISFPIVTRDGHFFGTLCAIDPRPAIINTPQTTGMFKLFAELVAFHLGALEEVASTKKMLAEEQQTAGLRDQFVAILGHDLRNPVGAVMNVAEMLLRMPLDKTTKRLANIIKTSSYRMKGLIENILDFTRGRLGDGISLNRKDNYSLEKILEEVITEFRIMYPGRHIETDFTFPTFVNCDEMRIAQLLSNLLGNALDHGEKNTGVKVTASCNSEGFSLSVANRGKKIPDAVKEHLFQPFYRGDIDAAKQGLGLGLFIASQIATAHGGVITVESTDQETCFTLKINSRS